MAGLFTRGFYTDDTGSYYPVRYLGPTVIPTFNPQPTAPGGDATYGTGYAYLGGISRRRYGCHARCIYARWGESGPPTEYDAFATIRIPIFTKTAFDAIFPETRPVFTYLGKTDVYVISKTNEKIR